MEFTVCFVSLLGSSQDGNQNGLQLLVCWGGKSASESCFCTECSAETIVEHG